MPDQTSIARHLRITGRVQGVGYRDWAVGTARSLGLAGWVRNRTDGSVEALASGAPESVEAFIVACHDGPALARVTDIAVQDADAPVQQGFEFLPTL
ncbi:acylphosphatase [Sphingomonas sp. LaA6.9]|uniref:acylphosphatase n=1 Tax=Sphingomonas sp. LaA6.9 TaxID=2919914 RepID=UPI001F50245B|nr:acylphosphatase [Sphingomonas sp. LaA6.9]MCJ8157544.1 acylphosphatase [Sphingomonas sp. LaA6.9]